MENEILKKLQPYSPKRRNNVHGFAFEQKYLLQSFKTQNTQPQISNEQLDLKILKVDYGSKRHNGTSKIFNVLRNKSEKGESQANPAQDGSFKDKVCHCKEIQACKG